MRFIPKTVLIFVSKLIFVTNFVTSVDYEWSRVGRILGISYNICSIRKSNNAYLLDLPKYCTRIINK